MTHYIPYARTGMSIDPTEKIIEWLGVDKSLELLGALPPEIEFPLLVAYLVEFAGAVELQYQRMAETLVDQAAISYNAHAMALKMIKVQVLRYGPRPIEKEASHNG